MKLDKLISMSNNNSWTNVNHIIENSDMELILISSLPFLKMWQVINHSELSYITNTLKVCGENKSEFSYIANEK